MKLFCAITATLCLATAAAASTLTGSTVTVVGDYPTLGTPITYSDTATIGPTGANFPSGTLKVLPTFGGGIITSNIDVGASSIEIAYTDNARAAIGSFNGLVFTFDSSGPVITGVSLDPLSNIDPLLSFGPHEIAVNGSGLATTTSSIALVDITLGGSTAATPEPGAFVLMLLGLALAGCANTRK